MMNPEDRLGELIVECIADEELSANQIYEKILEASSYSLEYHKSCQKKSQELFNILRGNSNVG